MIQEHDVVRLVRISPSVRPDYATGTTGELQEGDLAAVVFASPVNSSGEQALVLEYVEESGETRWLSEASSTDVEVVTPAR